MPVPRQIHIIGPSTNNAAPDEKKALREVISDKDDLLRQAKDLASQAEIALLNVEHSRCLAILREIKCL